MSMTDKCASCGEGSDNLKACTACKIVKYCNVQCQKAHRSKHKKACREWAAELFDEALFKQPPPNEECPICFLRLPNKASLRTYQSCCGKYLCNACTFGSAGEKKEGFPCPFCRKPVCGSYDEVINRLKARVDVGDAHACHNLASHYAEGTLGVQDMAQAIVLSTRASELGLADANFTMGCLYYDGTNLEQDTKKGIHYFQLAAMGGHVTARVRLAENEYNSDNTRRAMKHFIIAAKAGDDMSLKNVKSGYSSGYVTKEEFGQTLRAHKESNDDMRSNEREIMLCKLFRTRQLSGVVLLKFIGIEIKRNVQGVNCKFNTKSWRGRGALLRRQREYKEAIRVAQAKASVAIMAV